MSSDSFHRSTTGRLHLIMTTLPPQQPRHLLPAWGLSFCIHATVLAGAVAFLHDLPRIEPPVYRMEFLLTDLKSAADTAASQESPAATEHSSPIAPSYPRLANISSAHGSEQHPLTNTSIVHATVNPVTPATVEQREAHPSATAVDSTPVESPASIDRQVETLPSVIESSQAAASPTEEPIAKNLHDDVAHPSHAVPEISQNAVETASTPLLDSASSLSSSLKQHPPSSQPTSQPSITASQAGSQTTDSSSLSSQMGSDSPATTTQHTLVMNHPAITRTIPSKPDYGWLKDLLKRRIMSLQAYPRLARIQGWEGIVVVRATIKNDGSLLDAVVTESSGYASLDEEALKLMQRACPIRLQHDLGQSHIEVFIPVHYRLE
ncbi:MAG: TonB family protein [Nitrospira sp.]|nr:MAG: TonB family protein [Nitrospira sp.]